MASFRRKTRLSTSLNRRRGRHYVSACQRLADHRSPTDEIGSDMNALGYNLGLLMNNHTETVLPNTDVNQRIILLLLRVADS